MRVRSILKSLDVRGRSALIKLLPKIALLPPPLDTARYPSALLNALPKPNQYALLGLIAEHLLRLPSATLEDLLTLAAPHVASIEKIKNSKTTQPFLDHINVTRYKMDAYLGSDPVLYEPTLSYKHVEGHPDMKTSTQVFEVKLTGQLLKNWKDFVLQTFAYAALDPAVTTVHVVLPLQMAVLSYDVRDWIMRTAYLEKLELAALAAAPPAPTLSPVSGAIDVWVRELARDLAACGAGVSVGATGGTGGLYRRIPKLSNAFWALLA